MASQLFFCPHCESMLSKKSYLAHKRLYLDDDQWIKKRCLIPTNQEVLLTDTESGMEECDFIFDSNLDCDSIQLQESPPPPLFDPSEVGTQDIYGDESEGSLIP